MHRGNGDLLVCGTALLVVSGALLLATPGWAASPADELRAAEAGFAATMAARDHDGFAGFIADEAVFFNGDTELRGRAAVVDAWARFFVGAQAPFSWRPEVASVLDSGGLGLTSGPVFDPEGNQVGTFNSVWRMRADGSWEIVFDRGCP